MKIISKDKVKGLGTCYSASYSYMSSIDSDQQRFTIWETDWHELMIPWRIMAFMRPSTASSNEQLDPRCSTQTYHHPNQRISEDTDSSVT